MNDPPAPTTPEDWLCAAQQAAQVLSAGGIVAYPTETVWGLAAHPDYPQAVARLYDLKGRSADKPVQVSCMSAELALSLVQPSGAVRALASLWPGPLTLVTPAGAACPPDLAPGGRVGLRVPHHPVALELLRLCGGLLATTSCNRSGQPPAGTAQEAAALNLADLTLPDGGLPALGQASSVVLLPEGQILRHGAIPASIIRQLLNALDDGA